MYKNITLLVRFQRRGTVQVSVFISERAGSLTG